MQKKKAFTLVELLVVVALICMLAGLTVHQFTFMQGHVRSELDGLYQACLYMQRHALVTRQQQILTLDLDQHRYQFNGRNYKLAKGVQFGIIPAKGPPSSPNKHLTKACTFKNDQIIFYPDGIIDSGSVYLTNENHDLLYALTVAVSPYSYLRTYCYADTWRLLE